MNIIEYYDKTPGKQVGLMFVDAEKMFDNLNWEFFITLLEEMNFGGKFIAAIKGIYKNQRSYLIVNEERTDEFSLRKGTRQGCPLSPLLFILVLEIILRNAQENKEIKGLNLREHTYKYRANADDVMFITEDPSNTLPLLLKEVKTKIICKNITKAEEQEIQRNIKCEVVNKFKYLGIYFTKKNTKLFKNNYEKVIETIIKNLQSWNKLGHSSLGRIAIIKMMVLPKLMFLFQALPIINKITILDKWQKILVNFVWAGKKACIKMKALCDSMEKGRLQLPNLRLYFEAVALSWLQEWIKIENNRLLNWKGMI